MDLDVGHIDFAGGAKLHQAMTAGALDIIIGTTTAGSFTTWVAKT